MPKGPGGVLLLGLGMAPDTAPAPAQRSVIEPADKRAFAFVDGQNLYRHAIPAFGVTHPNYDVLALSRKVCELGGWSLKQVRFYTGVPAPNEDPFWHNFWSKKLLTLKRQGVHVFSRRLRYRNRKIRLKDGTEHEIRVAEEKGIDVRIALDILRLALNNDLDVAVVFSQDQDMSEVADELKQISRRENRWIKMVSAFPDSATSSNRRGINNTEWIRIDLATYNECVDPRDYR
jgi:Uncharacterized conserved protein